MKVRNLLLAFMLAAFAPAAWGQDGAPAGGGAQAISNAIVAVTDMLGAFLFYPIFGVPLLVGWLIVGGLFFTLYLGFVNVRLFRHAFKAISGKYNDPNDPGEVTHFQAFSSAVSATVGIGNIAGVAIAISIGGPGASVWMFIVGFFAMSCKFSEVTLGLKYREIDERGHISGGAFHYLEKGLAELGKVKLGKILAVCFAVLCIGGAAGGGNMFQSNQAVKGLEAFGLTPDMRWIPSLALSLLVGAVLIGGIKRIALVAEKIVPIMGITYVAGCLVVLGSNIGMLGDALGLMIRAAFTGEAAAGGLIGVIVTGMQRAAFSNESGLGSAPIAHSAAKTREPVREGAVALLEPFADTMVVCMLTGLAITVTGVYTEADGVEGIAMTSRAFATVADWFPKIVSASAILFAYSTMLSWSYYGERSWHYLFGDNRFWMNVYYVGFCVIVFIGGILPNIGVIINLSDLLLLSMSIPNLIGLYMLSGVVKRETKKYIDAYVKNGG